MIRNFLGHCILDYIRSFLTAFLFIHGVLELFYILVSVNVTIFKFTVVKLVREMLAKTKSEVRIRQGPGVYYLHT